MFSLWDPCKWPEMRVVIYVILEKAICLDSWERSMTISGCWPSKRFHHAFKMLRSLLTEDRRMGCLQPPWWCARVSEYTLWTRLKILFEEQQYMLWHLSTSYLMYYHVNFVNSISLAKPDVKVLVLCDCCV